MADPPPCQSNTLSEAQNTVDIDEWTAVWAGEAGGGGGVGSQVLDCWVWHKTVTRRHCLANDIHGVSPGTSYITTATDRRNVGASALFHLGLCMSPRFEHILLTICQQMYLCSFQHRFTWHVQDR